MLTLQIKNEQNEVLGILGIIYDLTDVYYKKNLGLILDDVKKILKTDLSLTDVSIGTLRIICNKLKWQAGEVWLLDESKQSLYKMSSFPKIISNEYTLEPKAGVFLEIFDNPNTIYVFKNTIILDKTYTTTIASCLQHNNEQLGVIFFYLIEDVELSDAIIELLKSVIAEFSIYLDEKFINERFAFVTNYNLITGLPNRKNLVSTLQLLCTKHADDTIVVVKLRVDQLNKINLALGYQVGNQVLKVLANYFVKDPHPNLYIAASLDDGYFGFIFVDIANLQSINSVLHYFLNISKQSFIISEHKIYVTVSIGVSIFPQDANNADLLLVHAKAAVERAHQAGGNIIEYASDSIQEEIFEEVSIELALHRALEKNEFVLYYQPKVDLKTGVIVGAEALIRWQDPNGTLHYPGYFLQIAEDSDLIIPIGEWVFREVCKQIADNQFGLPIAVNLSIRQFHKPDYFLQFVIKTIQEFKINPKMLSFEITESILIKHKSILDNLYQFKEMGIKIAFDDFGVQYCSLTYLKNYVPDVIKIDKSFTDGVPGSLTNTSIIRAIVTLAQQLGASITVEGAEKTEQIKFFIDLGCNELQSFYISPAVPADMFINLLKKNYKTLFDAL